jgi:hypothetical protein
MVGVMLAGSATVQAEAGPAGLPVISPGERLPLLVAASVDGQLPDAGLNQRNRVWSMQGVRDGSYTGTPVRTQQPVRTREQTRERQRLDNRYMDSGSRYGRGYESRSGRGGTGSAGGGRAGAGGRR